MRDRGSGRQGSDADAMDDAGLGCHAKGELTVRGSGTGRDFQRRPLAETVRSSVWALIGQAWSIMVDRSKAEVGVRKGAAGRAVSPGHH